MKTEGTMFLYKYNYIHMSSSDDVSARTLKAYDVRYYFKT